MSSTDKYWPPKKLKGGDHGNRWTEVEAPWSFNYNRRVFRAETDGSSYKNREYSKGVFLAWDPDEVTYTEISPLDLRAQFAEYLRTRGGNDVVDG